MSRQLRSTTKPVLSAPPSKISKKRKAETQPSKPSKKKPVLLGASPFPSHPYPTPTQCLQVHTLLTRAHGPAVRPPTVTASKKHAGCGEVPSVLDSLLRTVLSANTSATNSTRSFQGLVKKFGHDKLHGGVAWNLVRKAPTKEIYKAIESGGLANIKSKVIKDILDQVYEDGGKRTKDVGFDSAERRESARMSLDWLVEEADEEVMRVLTGFKGVGVKTATCVMMFCLKRSAFPVDTHVFRISRLLGWVPTPGYAREILEQQNKASPPEDNSDEGYNDQEDDSDEISTGETKRKKVVKREVKVTRDTTFLHLDARIPDELKYGLHQLLIRHGRYCPTCNAAGGRKFGIGQNGKLLVTKTKKVTVKEEQDDGGFKESTIDVQVKEEDDSDEDLQMKTEAKIKTEEGVEEEASELGGKPYVPIDAAGGTGERTGGNPDGSCILGDLISWERLI